MPPAHGRNLVLNSRNVDAMNTMDALRAPDVSVYTRRTRPVAILAIAILGYLYAWTPIILCALYTISSLLGLLEKTSFPAPPSSDESATVVGSPSHVHWHLPPQEDTDKKPRTAAALKLETTGKLTEVSPRVLDTLESPDKISPPTSLTRTLPHDLVPAEVFSRYRTPSAVFVVNGLPLDATSLYSREGGGISIHKVCLQPREAIIKRFRFAQDTSEVSNRSEALKAWENEVQIIRDIQTLQSPFLCECLGVVNSGIHVDGMLIMVRRLRYAKPRLS